MTPGELRALGEALYGAWWQSALAADLGMGARHMRKLAAGEVAISDRLAAEIATIAKQRAAAMRAALRRMKR